MDLDGKESGAAETELEFFLKHRKRAIETLNRLVVDARRSTTQARRLTQESEAASKTLDSVQDAAIGRAFLSRTERNARDIEKLRDDLARDFDKKFQKDSDIMKVRRSPQYIDIIRDELTKRGGDFDGAMRGVDEVQRALAELRVLAAKAKAADLEAIAKRR